jgi:hypothetical protein
VLSLWGRRVMSAAAALCWAAAVAIVADALAAGHPGTATVLLFTLDIGAAMVLTTCAWLERIITPLVTSHLLGVSAGFRSGLRIARTGQHHKRAAHGSVTDISTRRKGASP